MVAHKYPNDRYSSSFLPGEKPFVPPNLNLTLSNRRIEDAALLADWARVVRMNGTLPTQIRYRHDGQHDPDAFRKRFGSWAALPAKFREFAQDKPEYADVLALLPADSRADSLASPSTPSETRPLRWSGSTERHSKLDDRPTYGNPLDFRGLRHEPVNEQGVVFLFGMVARELGYLVEAVQAGYPDCEAKRQVDRGKWQRVRIEFEFESRHFRDHGHAADGCDLIVCWRHNWPDCPRSLEVVELSTVIRSLSKSPE
ncbi:MAG: hypothetical protein HYY17_09530 [Planctomycetes bacterium]|nr:hypothetical protein [Planctomycetota bacterium]